MAIYQLGAQAPHIDPSCYVAETAQVIGKVTLAPHASVWFNCTLRGDNEAITVGENSNIQESCVLHTDLGFPLQIGRNVTIGHQAMLHGCSIGDGALIGIQAVILNGARIGRDCLVGAGALVTEGKEFPDGSLIVGSPARAIRQLDAAAIERMHANTAHYVARAQTFKTELRRIDPA